MIKFAGRRLACWLLLIGLVTAGRVAGEPELLLSVSKGQRADTYDVAARKVAFADLVRALARAARTAVRIEPGVQAHSMDLEVEGARLEPILRVMAQSQELLLRPEGTGWVFSAGQSGPIELWLRVVELPATTTDKGFSGWDLLPAGMSLVRGRFEAQLAALVAAGRAGIIHESRAGAAGGAPVELVGATDTDLRQAADICFSGFAYGGTQSGLVVVPQVAPDGSVILGLTLQTVWKNAAQRNLPALETGEGGTRSDDFTLKLELPRVKIRSGEQVLLRGWEALGEEMQPEGRERVLVLQVSVR